MMHRRSFLKASAFAAAAAFVPKVIFAAEAPRAAGRIRFGVCADVHKDVIYDADARLRWFVDEINKKKVDFIIQLGDFCWSIDKNLPFLEIWKSFKGAKYHVIGNHDMDSGCAREYAVKWLGATGGSKGYYSFDAGGIHFVVLDGNDKPPYSYSGYAKYIGPDQKHWLETDLASTNLPTMIFSHQPLDRGIDNQEEILKVIKDAQDKADFGKVFACLSGHNHDDYLVTIDGVHHIQINSMSYDWVGAGPDGKYLKKRFSPHLEHAYPYMQYTIPYLDPLYATVTVKDGILTLEGTKTEFIPPTELDLGLKKHPTIISDRKLKIT